MQNFMTFYDISTTPQDDVGCSNIHLCRTAPHIRARELQPHTPGIFLLQKSENSVLILLLHQIAQTAKNKTRANEQQRTPKGKRQV